MDLGFHHFHRLPAELKAYIVDAVLAGPSVHFLSIHSLPLKGSDDSDAQAQHQFVIPRFARQIRFPSIHHQRLALASTNWALNHAVQSAMCRRKPPFNSVDVLTGLGSSCGLPSISLSINAEDDLVCLSRIQRAFPELSRMFPDEFLDTVPDLLQLKRIAFEWDPTQRSSRCGTCENLKDDWDRFERWRDQRDAAPARRHCKLCDPGAATDCCVCVTGEPERNPPPPGASTSSSPWRFGRCTAACGKHFDGDTTREYRFKQLVEDMWPADELFDPALFTPAGEPVCHFETTHARRFNADYFYAWPSLVPFAEHLYVIHHGIRLRPGRAPPRGAERFAGWRCEFVEVDPAADGGDCWLLAPGDKNGVDVFTVVDAMRRIHKFNFAREDEPLTPDPNSRMIGDRLRLLAIKKWGRDLKPPSVKVLACVRPGDADGALVSPSRLFANEGGDDGGSDCEGSDYEADYYEAEDSDGSWEGTLSP